MSLTRERGHALTRIRAWPLGQIGFFAAVIYLIVLGGSNAGEQLPLYRAINLLLAAAVVIVWIRRADEADRLDAAVMAGVLLFAVAALFSSNLRQSLDSVVQVLAFAALFSYARRLFADERGMAALAWVLGALCIGMAAFFAAMWGGTWLEWARGSGFTEVPPLSLPLPTGLYLHRHDIALLILMLAPALAIPIGFGRLRVLRVVVFAVIAALLVIDGSRTVVLAIAVAIAAAAAVAAKRSGRVRLSVPRTARSRVLVGLAALAVLAIAVVVGEPILSRVLEFRTLSARGNLWGGAVSLWLADPLTGSGPGTFLFALFETGYYDTNTFFPRNTDGAPLMLLAETGVVGAAGALLIAFTLLRTRMSALPYAPVMLVAPIAFVVAGIGQVPADFVYLVVPAVVWLAAAFPADAAPTPVPSSQPRSRALAGIATALVGVTAVAMAFTVAADAAYQDARVAVGRGELGDASAHLRRATGLDPRFALYWRALGAVELGRDNHAAARAALDFAAHAERRDPVTHRLAALAAVAAGDPERARTSAEAARRLQRAHAIQHAVDAIAARAAGAADAGAHVDRFVVMAPWVMGLEDWPAALGDRRGAADAGRLLDDWAAMDGPDLVMQPAFLSAMAGSPQHAEAVDAATAHLARTRDAVRALFACDLDAAAESLAAAETSERGNAMYWVPRLMLARLTGEDSRDEEAFADITRLNAGALDRFTSSPLGENWAYRRGRLPAIDLPFDLPPSDSGFGAWLDDPRGAAAAAGAGTLAACEP
jgi:O-antigen ligase